MNFYMTLPKCVLFPLQKKISHHKIVSHLTEAIKITWGMEEAKKKKETIQNYEIDISLHNQLN